MSIIYLYRELEKNCTELYRIYTSGFNENSFTIKNKGEKYEIGNNQNLEISSISYYYKYFIIDSTEVNKLLNSFNFTSYPLPSGVSLIINDNDYIAYDRALGSINSDNYSISNVFVNLTFLHYSMIIRYI